MHHINDLGMIPVPVKDVTPERLGAFVGMLRQYFDEYPADDQISASAGAVGDASKWREKAVASRYHPEISAYYACDTGVPNELILGAYALLFL